MSDTKASLHAVNHTSNGHTTSAAPTAESPARTVVVAASQFACGLDQAANVAKAEAIVREAARRGAQIILIQELFEGVYFCQDQEGVLFDWAKPATLEENPLLARFSALSEELGVVLPISFFEKANNAHYNSLIVFDCGKPLGLYRKSHIPDGPGYQEKFYFNPGDTGFKVFKTRFGAIGVAVCWDQWFPEAARVMALQGAEILFYPTAIGSEPQDQTLDSRHHWMRVMQGHAGANLLPLVASNRIGKEKDRTGKNEINFYGNSFIADSTGHLLAHAGDSKEEILTAKLDLEALRLKRVSWGVFRDRRPDLYQPITSLDGKTPHNSSPASAAAHTMAPVPDYSNWKPKFAAAAIASNASAKSPELKTPKADGFRMPAEWEPHTATWILWPYRTDNWRAGAEPARKAFTQVIAAIAKYERVNVCARSVDWLNAKKQLSGLGPNVRVIEMASDDAWMRDIGCTFVRNDSTGEVRGIDFQFNSWGGANGGCYTYWENDSLVKPKMLDYVGAEKYVSPYIMEGGSFHVDGEGTCLVTGECLLNANRNPKATKPELEAHLCQMLNVSKIIWLPRGVYGDDDTNGHVDNLCCFTAPTKVVLCWTDDGKDPQYAISTEALKILESSTDAKGRPLTVVKLYQPTPMNRTAADVTGIIDDLKLTPEPRKAGQRLAASYVNFYIANGAIICPAFGDAKYDALAKKTLAGCFPDRVIEQIADGREILLGGGNIHCITQQQCK